MLRWAVKAGAFVCLVQLSLLSYAFVKAAPEYSCENSKHAPTESNGGFIRGRSTCKCMLLMIMMVLFDLKQHGRRRVANNIYRMPP